MNTRRVSLKWRLMVLLTLLVLVSVAISSVFYIQFYSKSAYRQFDEISEQSLKAAAQSIHDKLETMNTYSKVILSNQSVQNYLRSSAQYPKLSYLNSSNRFLKEFITSFSEIDAVYLIDLQGHSTSVDQLNDSSTQGTLVVNQTNQAHWFTQISQLKGSALLSAQGDDIFINKPAKPIITLMRLVNDLDTQKPIGALALNFNASVISSTIEPLDLSTKTSILLLDEKCGQILDTDMPSEQIADLKSRVMQSPGKTVWTNHKGSHVRESSVRIEGTQWYLVSHTELSNSTLLKGDLVGLMLGAIMFNGLVILVGAIWISRSITRPVTQLARAMTQVQDGQLKTTEYISRIPEMMQLKDVYNQMVEQIAKLLDQVKQEEQTKRRAELNVLQAQIKPHFLYNTFDSISALALMGNSEAVYQAIGALGQFYRLSLSSGLEVIPLRDEIAIISHYLTIQNMRYQNIFDLELDIAPLTEQISVLKLVLQPLVENAIYHGIKPLQNRGLIYIGTQLKVDASKTYLVIIVKDNGVGIMPDQLKKMEDFTPGQHFGFSGTRERLRLFYGTEVVSVNSKALQGTTITLTLPLSDEILTC